jgi:hypothetical protein
VLKAIVALRRILPSTSVALDKMHDNNGFMLLSRYIL